MRRRIVWFNPRLTIWMGGSRFLLEVLLRLKEKYDLYIAVQREKVEVNIEVEII